MTEFTAIQTRTNTHRLFGAGTVCNPVKLPKGELFIEGVTTEERSMTTAHADGTKETVTWTVTKSVVCNKCNKVNHRGF